MAWYKNGTVTLTQGSSAVIGAGTAWIANVDPGETFLAPDGKIYEIGTVTSDTGLNLIPVYAGASASGQVYSIMPTQGYLKKLAADAAALIAAYRSNTIAGWTPTLAIVSDGERRVQQIVDWTGGTGTKPVTGLYVGVAGPVSTASQAVDIRGPAGTGGGGGGGGGGTDGANGWSPVFSLVGDGDRRVQRIVDWTGGSGTKPSAGLYVGSAGLVTTAAQAVDIRGGQGVKGDIGNAGWTPVFAVVSDGNRRVQQVADWVGGGGTKPAVGQYVGANGLVTPIANAVDVRGTPGADADDGADGWTPVFALVVDGARSVQQVTDWVGGTGAKPVVGQYVGPTGFVTSIASAVDIRGATGQGIDGDDGSNGWAPILAIVADVDRRVVQVVDWAGGTGTKPATGQFIGAAGLVVSIAQAVDIRGPAGSGSGGGGSGTDGTNGWSAVLAVISDGARRVHQVVDWVGGTGTKPADGQFIGATGFVGTAAQAVDMRGTPGADGDDGDAGTNGWSAVLAIVSDGERRVQQIVDWTGGTGTKPAVGAYIGATGLVVLIADAVDIRGAAGASGGGGGGNSYVIGDVHIGVKPTSGVWIAMGLVYLQASYPELFGVIGFRANTIDWTQRTLPVSGNWRGPSFANGLWVALAANSTIAITSPDGITWTQGTLPVSGDWQPPSFANGLWVALAANSTIAITSPDGITWTQRTLPVSGTWQPPAFANGLWVALATNSTIAITWKPFDYNTVTQFYVPKADVDLDYWIKAND